MSVAFRGVEEEVGKSMQISDVAEGGDMSGKVESRVKLHQLRSEDTD